MPGTLLEQEIREQTIAKFVLKVVRSISSNDEKFNTFVVRRAEYIGLHVFESSDSDEVFKKINEARVEFSRD
jgi:hypothetical protein